MFRLLSDVKGLMNQEVFGAAGERILIVVERGNVVIVESLSGNKYSTVKENIEEFEDKPESKEPPVKKQETKIDKPAKPEKTSKSKGNTNTPTLF